MNHLLIFRATLLIYALSGVTVQAGEVSTLNMPREAQDTLKHYSAAVINGDANQIRHFLHPLLLDAMLAKEIDIAKIYQKMRKNQLLPDREEFGNAENFSDAIDRLYFVPAVRIQKGFPDDIRHSYLYVVASSDAGKSWKIFDNNCGMNEEWIKKLAPNYKGEPSLNKMREKAAEFANNGNHQSLR